MSSSPRWRVANPPARPLLLYDGTCGFCKTWIARWRERTGDAVDDEPSQSAGARFPEIPAAEFARAVQLVLPDGTVLSGAEAVARLLSLPNGRGVFLWTYRRIPGVAPAAELAYRVIAGHRSTAAAATRLLWGRSVLRPTYFAANALFLRLLGLCYLAAFLSFRVQADGLVGERGILPIGALLDWVRAQTGSERYWLLPTFSWLAPGDSGLHAACAAGALASLLLIAGVLPAAAAIVSWACYLSVTVSGQVFLEFQWDLLLLETGLLAIFLAPPKRFRIGRGLAAPALSRFLLVWLLFRLMLSSGVVKLASGDPTWRNLTALRYHFETQCLPPWTAWFAHQSPAWLLTLSCVVMFFIELAVPFLFFAPRRLRLIGCGLTMLLQLMIAATGNYAFFNWLTIALGVLLIDDASLPTRWREAATDAAGKTRGGSWPRWILVPAAVWLLAASSVPFLATLGARDAIPAPLIAVYRAGAPLRSANGYGLFAVMTTSRPEIVVEGSDDGETWRPYEFRWKPGDPARRPAFVAPHQPRLDWQMWFAALGTYEENPWLIRLLQRLLEGSPDVRRLLAEDRNPFPKEPPRYVRALVYDYHFTTAAERARTGAWWKRELKGPYCPVLSKR
ncbi:MAG TPA: lipase maturation factor family protein [Thermoanaerobaculia bacterium]